MRGDAYGVEAQSLVTDQRVRERLESQAFPATFLTTSGLTKRFPGVVAVDQVDLTLYSGEIVALLGQNGAGKSTLIQMLAGSHPSGSYDGEIFLAGARYQPQNVAAAEAAGIVLIPQEINIVPDMTVAENILLNHEPTRFGLIDRPALLARAREVLAEFGLELDPAQRMGALDLATQQLVVIARALSRRARLLILDEPTAALTEAEAQRLFDRMRGLRDRGVTCVFVSHRLAEVFAIADRILVMRDGRLRGDHLIGETSREAIVAEMIGGSLVAPGAQSAPTNQSLLEVEHLTVFDAEEPDRKRVDDLSFALHAGEVLGLFGLVGAGCSTAATAIFGGWRGKREGVIQIDGTRVVIDSPADAIRHGVGMVGQDRRETLIHDHPVADNIVLASLPDISSHGFVDRDQRSLTASKLVETLSIRTRSVESRVATLSGGNQQKVQVARWLAARSRLLILVDPTRGVDVGARAEINRLWQQLAGEGYALLLVSSEAEELIEVCHRILVMRNGRVVSEFAGEAATERQLLAAAAGV